ncbi:MAG TPA: phosphoribosylformylglycinamidine synthase subunit PurL [Verrucomicrobiae bacterium]|nr:phosphoribosylformylglycinamidine synthase subunit PurL [Verrucomicrobiae bacterium]
MLETEIKVTPELAAEHGLTAEEYARIQKILGREPNFTELGIFSVMWSEHCSYKSSKVHLRRLPTRGPQVLQGPGENAGVVDIGDGLAAAFKMESHNHPSYVEPFQGAATGVGGILRDIFTMGARPIAVLDSLRFGPISSGASGAKALLNPSDEMSRLKPRPTTPSDFSTGTSATSSSATSGSTHSASFVGRGFSRDISAAQQSAALAPGGVDEETIARNRRILDGVVRGIAHYGNCFGVPTVGGEVQFEPGYSANPLVNVLALGIAKKEDLFFAKARGVGNPVIYVGAKTGRDGIHGASLLASAEFTEESQQKRPNVQVGDPFMEKLLLEACLEAMHTGAIVAIQDMGAAGLTSTSCEMASRGGLGIEIELARVPQREPSMTAYEMMLSESQERMLLVAERGREKEVLKVFAKWGLDAVEIGRVTPDGLLRVLHRAKIVAEIPAHALAEEGPVYQRPLAPPAPVAQERLVEFGAAGANLTENFRALLAAPAIASKRWIWEQYDYMVRTNTLEPPGAGDAAVVRIKGTKRALALASDGNGRWCRLDPFIGAQLAVAEAARNVACSGAKPMAATNCLNFGSPEKPEVMWQFSRAIDGIAEACTALEIPITGGNVSFYNETLGRSIDPTPVLGVLGMIEDASRGLGMAFRAEDDYVLLLDGDTKDWLVLTLGSLGELKMYIPVDRSTDAPSMKREFSSSEYARTIRGIESGAPPTVNLAAEKRLIALLVALASDGKVQSAHDVSDGGLAVTLAESCFASNGLSLRAALTSKEPDEAALFGERGARAIVSVTPENLAAVRRIAAQYEVAVVEVGRVSRGEFRIELNGQTVVSAEVPSLADAWSGALERLLSANDLRKAE